MYNIEHRCLGILLFTLFPGEIWDESPFICLVPFGDYPKAIDLNHQYHIVWKWTCYSTLLEVLINYLCMVTDFIFLLDDFSSEIRPARNPPAIPWRKKWIKSLLEMPPCSRGW